MSVRRRSSVETTILVSVLSCFVGFGGAIFEISGQDDVPTFPHLNDKDDLPTLQRPNESGINNSPIIGVLSQSLHSFLVPYFPSSSSYIVASYVKFLESAGARVVPVLIGKDRQHYEQIFSKLNGLLLPGGGVSDFTSEFSKVSKIFFDLAKEANSHGDAFPIWGTCQGFEMLAVLSNGWKPTLTSCNSEMQNLPLNLLDGWNSSRILSQAPSDVLDQLTSLPITMNFHSQCLTMQNFTRFSLDKFWTALSINNDKKGLEFISSIEAREFPFFATQFHPEINTFEWANRLPDVIHSREAVNVAFYFAQFFVEQAKKSEHAFEDRNEEEAALIYNYVPHYTGNIWMFQQIYVFP